jgi:hypothetical protein
MGNYSGTPDGFVVESHRAFETMAFETMPIVPFGP